MSRLPVDCVHSLRRARRELASGMPVSALAALMAAQNMYARYVMGGGFGLATVKRLQRCIRAVEDQVYPVIDLRGRKERKAENGRNGLCGPVDE